MEEEKSLSQLMIQEEIMPRLTTVENEVKILREEVATIKTDLVDVKNGQKDLELTVLKQGQTNREILEQSNTVNKELQEQSKGMISQLVELVIVDKKSAETITVKKLDVKMQIILGLCGAGGLGGIIAGVVTLIPIIVALFK